MHSLPSRLPRLHAIAVAASVVVALMLGGGSGLPGVVWALSGAGAHVCTCSSGGSHASCPVCSHALQAPSHSHAPSVDGMPCGDRRLAAGPMGEPAMLPPSLVELVPVVDRVAPVPATGVDPPFCPREPATPPPRTALPG
jgi:hypothetical protein